MAPSEPVPVDNYIITRSTSEAGRLELQHRLMLSCQGYYLHPSIPIHSTDDTTTTPLRIAELATGTTIFLRELAPYLPASTELHGFDISDKMFPPADQRPNNMKLHVANIKEPFDARWHGYFDIVHIRLIEAAMRKEEWGPTLRNVVTLLKPGGWLQWVEDDRAHAPEGSWVWGPKLHLCPRYTALLMSNERAEHMTYGYMSLNKLMADPEFGGLEDVDRDAYVIDREDDGGKLRLDWAIMGVGASWSMLKAREEAGVENVEELTGGIQALEEGYRKDVERGFYQLVRVGVFTGRKKL